VRPPHAGDAAIRAGWRLGGIRVPRPRLRIPVPTGLGLKARLAVVAVVVMAVTLVAVAAWNELAPRAAAPSATPAVGTAILSTTTCADWRDASQARRMVIVSTLAVAATQPDPENPGATLGDSAAYGLFQRVCGPTAPDSTLLYESYNRAASFSSVRAGSVGVSGRFGRP
jgi:hypothetical protein